MPHPSLRTTVIGSYPFPSWLEFACRNLDQFGETDREELVEDAVLVAIHDQLVSLGIAHEWHVYSGDHSAQYWSAHVPDYLGYYAKTLCRIAAACPRQQ